MPEEVALCQKRYNLQYGIEARASFDKRGCIWVFGSRYPYDTKNHKRVSSHIHTAVYHNMSLSRASPLCEDLTLPLKIMLCIVVTASRRHACMHARFQLLGDGFIMQQIVDAPLGSRQLACSHAGCMSSLNGGAFFLAIPGCCDLGLLHIDARRAPSHARTL